MSEIVEPKIFFELHAARIESAIYDALDNLNSRLSPNAQNEFASFSEIRELAIKDPNSIPAAKMLLMAMARNKFGIRIAPIGDLADSGFGFRATRMQDFNEEI